MKTLNKEIFDLYKKSATIIDECIRSQKKQDRFFKTGITPMFYKEFDTSEAEVLFVGINPSLTEDMLVEFERVYGSLDFLQFSKLNDKNFSKVSESLVQFQEALKGRSEIEGVKRIGYFTAFENILKECCSRAIGWEHYDLFSYRNTSQYSLTRVLGKRNLQNRPKLKNYFHESMQRLKRVLENGKFKIVIIANAKVSKLLQEHQIISGSRVGKTEVLFSKQITGGLRSEERSQLIRDISRILKLR